MKKAKPVHHTAKFRADDGVELFYQSWRPAQPRAVLVFVHGMGEHSGRYQFPVRHFTDRGYACYALDLRGHGHSGGRRMYANRLDEFLKDLKKFLHLVEQAEQKARGEKDARPPLFLVGHSFGGQLVLNYAIQNPKGIAGVVTSSPNIQVAIPIRPLKKRAAQALSCLLPALQLANELDPKLLSHDPEVVRDYENDPLVQRKITIALAAQMFENQEHLPALAAYFRLPLLMMHAGDDRICSPQGTEAFFQAVAAEDKTFHRFPGLFHEIFNEVERDQVFDVMEKWLEARIT